MLFHPSVVECFEERQDIFTSALDRLRDGGFVGLVFDVPKFHVNPVECAEREARQAGRGLWAASDPAASEPIRNRAVDDLFVPRPASVRRADGRLPQDRAPVRAEPTAAQELRGADAVTYAEDPIPLVGVDRDARVGLVGGLLINEAYEQAEEFTVDTAAYEQFVFLTNLCTWLSDREGSILIDGGHGQFGVEYALSAEDAAYYRRYLEGIDLAFDQQNRLSTGFLDGGRALIVTTPVGRFGDGELERLRQFRDDGGGVVLLASGAAPAFARAHLNHVAAGLGSDLRANADRVRDDQHNLAGDATLPTTTQVDRSLPLFGAYADGLQPATLDVDEITADPTGDNRDALAEETVTLVNRGDSTLDLTGWTLRDLASHVFDFPEGFELTPGDTVTVHTGSGTNTAHDLFWDAGRPIWNNRGDTIIVIDTDGYEVLRVSY